MSPQLVQRSMPVPRMRHAPDKSGVLNPERRTAAAASGWWVCDLKMARSIVPAIGVIWDKGRVAQAIRLRRLGRRIACPTLRVTLHSHRAPTAATACHGWLRIPAFRCYQWMCYSDYGAQGRHPTKRSLHPASFIRALPTEIASLVLVQREWGSAAKETAMTEAIRELKSGPKSSTSESQRVIATL